MLHEGVHALVLKIFGAKNVGIGFKVLKYSIPIFYVRSNVKMISRNKWIIVALAPLVLSPLSVLMALLLPDSFLKATLAWMSIINTSGASGDMILVLLSLCFSKNALLIDMGEYGIMEGEENPVRKKTVYSILTVMDLIAWPLIAILPIVAIILMMSFVTRSSLYLGGIPIVEFIEEKTNGYSCYSQIGAGGFVFSFTLVLAMELLVRTIIRVQRSKSLNSKLQHLKT
ncbi:MAG: DUF3267 domain-containing protein [Thermoproteota archaeon]